MWSWYTGRWWVGCYIWYSEKFFTEEETWAFQRTHSCTPTMALSDSKPRSVTHRKPRTLPQSKVAPCPTANPRENFTCPWNLRWRRGLTRDTRKRAILAYRCLHNTAPSYLSESLQLAAGVDGRRRLIDVGRARNTSFDARRPHVLSVVPAEPGPPSHWT